MPPKPDTTLILNGNRIPDLIIAGAPRSGTTLACEILSRHPGIHVLKPFIPEPKVCLADHGPDDEGYLDHYGQLFNDAPEGACCVEKTSNYWENENARERLARILPETRFVFILREPVARAYSNWRWSTQNGLETLPFAQAFDRFDRASPLPPHLKQARPFDYLPRSQYGRLAKSWIAAVGLERLRFYLFEQLIADLRGWASDFHKYAGVEPRPATADGIGTINATTDQSPIDPTIEARLRALLRPETERFAALTGIDIGPWGY